MENSKEAQNKKNLALLVQQISKKKELISNLMNKLEEAHKELETMEKERDELQTKNTELQDELDNVKASREKGDDEIAGFIADANREMEELDAKIEQATNYWNNRKQN